MVAKIVTTLCVENETFYICDYDGYYCAVSAEYITDGKINTPLNGLQMNASKDLNICMNATIMQVKFKNLLKYGLSNSEALEKLLQMMR